jgi:hypothetical protein
MGYGIKDSPWHIAVLKSDGTKRQATRCIYFRHIKSKSGFCSIKGHRCTGSAHCDEYKEKSHTNGNATEMDESKNFDAPSNQPPNLPSKKDVLIGEKMLSPKKDLWTIVDANIDQQILYVVQENNEPQKIHKIGFSALKNPPIGRWMAIDESIQKYILYLLEN